MKEQKERDHSFLLGFCITLGTIVIGLISYIVFTSDFPGREKAHCEYAGWAYATGETFDAIDGCNTCACNDGIVVCTEMTCEEPMEDLN